MTDDILAKNRPTLPRPPHLHLTAEQLRDNLAALPPGELDQLVAVAEDAHRSLNLTCVPPARREKRPVRRWGTKRVLVSFALPLMAISLATAALVLTAVSAAEHDAGLLTALAPLVILVAFWLNSRPKRWRKRIQRKGTHNPVMRRVATLLENVALLIRRD